MRSSTEGTRPTSTGPTSMAGRSERCVPVPGILSIRNGSKKIYLGVFLGRFETLNHWPDIYDHKKYR